MRIVRRILRVLFYSFLVVLAFAAGAAAVLTLTGKGKENLAGLISNFASSADQKITLSELDGIWSGRLRLDHLVLEDRDGPWLAVRGVEVDWSPLSLLSGTFSADRIFAGRIEVARAPKPAEGAPKTGGGGFSLPVSIEVKDIDLPDIAIGEQLAGGVAAVAAKGSARAEASPLQVETDLKLTRTDGHPGHVDASIHFVPDDNRLDVDVRGSEPAGGIIANLLKLPGAPPVDITLSGSGPVANWQGSGTFAVDGVVVTRIEGRHRFTDRGSAIEAKGDGEFSGFVPEALKPLLAGRTAFDIAGTATTSGGADIERATIESDTLTGTASGTVDPAGASDFSLEVKAKGIGVPLSFGTEESPIDITVQSASVRALGDGSAPNLDIGAVLSKVATKANAVDRMSLLLHSDAFDVRARTGPITGSVTAEALIVDNPTVAPLVAGEVKAELSGVLSQDTLIVNSGVIRSDGLDGSFGGAVTLADGSIKLDIKADVAASALPPAARPVLADRVTLSASIARDALGHVSADPFSLSSGELSAQGRIRTEDDQLDASLTGKLGNVGLLSPQAKGAVDIALTAKGPLAAPDLPLTVTSDRIEAAQREITGLKLVATGKADIAHPAADVALSGIVAGETLDGRATLSTAGGRREVKGLTLSLGNNRIAGDLVLDENFLPLGTIDFNLPEIGSLAALALETAEGDLGGTIRFSNEGGKPQIALDAHTGALSRGDLSARDVAIAATVADYVAAPAISGTVRAASVTSGATVISGIDVKLKRDGPWTGFNGGATVADIPARAVGRVQVAGGSTTIELASGEATVRGVKAVIDRATTVKVAGGAATLDKLAVRLGGGTAVVSGTAGSSLNLNATLSAIPASLANSFAPGLDAAGSISGAAKVTGVASNPSVGYSINWTGAQTSQTRGAGFGAMAIASSGDFAGGRLTFTANAGDGSGLGLKGGGTVDTGGSRALSLDFNGSVPFSFLTARLAAQGISLSGGANVSLQIRGTTASPVIGGSVRASGARFVHAPSGMAIDDLNADIALGNGVATLRSLTGTLSSGGRLTASGTVGIDPATGFPADLSIKLADGRYTDGRVVTATLSGNLAVKGPLVSAPVVSGTIDFGKTVITVPERLPGSLASLDVKHKNAPADVRQQDAALRPPAQSSGGSGGLALDVMVNANNQIFVQGRGLDAELGGNLRLTGPAGSPQATGQFTLRRGRLSILGKRLDFKSGTITFSGSLVPYLDLSAESTAGDATVVVTVNGPANNPSFDFSSIPALPEDEVLARLIFGRSMSNLSPIQIAQLAEAAAQFAGVGGSTSLLEKLRSNLGVDDLDVKTDEKGGTSVSAGKYLNDRTYVTIEKGDRAGSGKATIDLNVGKGVKLRGEATDGGTAKGGIFYEKEY